MEDPRQKLHLSLVDPYYPLAYQDGITSKLRGSSIIFFDYLQTYLRNIDYEYVHFDEYQVVNRSLTDLGGALGAIVDGTTLTELTGAGALPDYLKVFDLTPPIGTDVFAFYEADIGSEPWSPLSYFIPFSPLILALSIVSLVIIGLLECRGRRKSSALASILAGISSALFVFGVTFIVFAYGAGFQGNLIAATPTEKIPYDAMLRSFESGARLWYYHYVGLADFSSLSYIPKYVEEDFQKLIGLMCARPGVVTVSMYTEEFLELKLHSAPAGCSIRPVNMVEPSQPSPTYYNFKFGYYYFLLPKRLPIRLREAINFVTNAVFQADQRDGRLLYSSVKTKSFADITPQPAPLADYSPLSLHAIGVIILISVSLLILSFFMFALEIVVHRLELAQRAKRFELTRRFQRNYLEVAENEIFTSGIGCA